MMNTNRSNRSHDWPFLCELASKKRNPEKLLDLIVKINQVWEESHHRTQRDQSAQKMPTDRNTQNDLDFCSFPMQRSVASDYDYYSFRHNPRFPRNIWVK
jgi:hypothetical protein